jgi:hypothetical protein
VERARLYPGRLAADMLRRWNHVVGLEGEDRSSSVRAPPCAKAYYLRVLTNKIPANKQRDRREALTLCTILDHLALGRFLCLGFVGCLVSCFASRRFGFGWFGLRFAFRVADAAGALWGRSFSVWLRFRLVPAGGLVWPLLCGAVWQPSLPLFRVFAPGGDRLVRGSARPRTSLPNGGKRWNTF